jgi:hypothetical protein
METFAEFLINLLWKLGIYYVFSVIFVAALVYVLSMTFIKNFFPSVFKDKQASTISLIFAITSAFLVTSLFWITKMLSYFLALVSISLVILLFAFAIISFVLEKKPTVKTTSSIRTIFLIALMLIAVFAILSYFIVNQQAFLPLMYGKPTSNTSAAPVDITMYILKPEVFIVPFLFIILGVAIMTLGGGTSTEKK